MTRRDYADLGLTSPDGRLRLDGRSPDNAPGARRHGWGDQRGFRYELADASGRVLHVREQEEPAEGSPLGGWLSNDGFAVVRAHRASWSSDQLLVFDAALRKRLVVLVASPGYHRDSEPDEVAAIGGSAPTILWEDEHVGGTTAGPSWAGGSLPYFAPLGGRPHFVWRTAWGRRLVIDLSVMTVLSDDDDRGASEPLRTFERDAVRAVLGRTSVGRSETLGALFAAAELVDHGSIPAVQRIERSHDEPTSKRECRALGRGWWSGPRSVCLVARRTLRSLGERAPVGGGVAFFRETKTHYFEPADAHGLVVAPAERADIAALRSLAGASAEAVLSVAGAPDWIEITPDRWKPQLSFGGETWEWDGPDGTTKLTWSDPVDASWDAIGLPRVVARVDTVTPEWSRRLRETLF